VEEKAPPLVKHVTVSWDKLNALSPQMSAWGIVLGLDPVATMDTGMDYKSDAVMVPTQCEDPPLHTSGAPHDLEGVTVTVSPRLLPHHTVTYIPCIAHALF
jgi:hypothetical protein